MYWIAFSCVEIQGAIHPELLTVRGGDNLKNRHYLASNEFSRPPLVLLPMKLYHQCGIHLPFAGQ
jgi:hypothetical protein